MIHPTAIVDPRAVLGDGVEVGPYAVIGAGVEIGAGSTIGAHCVIHGPTKIGRDNRIFPHCSLGADPQDKKYAGEPTSLEIGDRNTIREFCTFNRGTAQDVGVTRIGNDNWVMAYVHIAHDCQIGSNTIFANSTQLAGHVHIGDWVVLGGFTGIHQFVHVGAHAMTAIAAVLVQDLPPYVMAAGNTAGAKGINAEGLKRRGFSAESIARIKAAYKTLYRSGLTLQEAIVKLREQCAAEPAIEPLARFVESSKRGIVR